MRTANWLVFRSSEKRGGEELHSPLPCLLTEPLGSEGGWDRDSPVLGLQ